MPSRSVKVPVPGPKAKAKAAYAKVPTRTVAADPGRYSKTPHEYGDILITPDKKGRTKLSGALQRDLVYWIERHTWGKNVGTPLKIVRPEFAKLSMGQLSKMCGTDRRTVARAIADLSARGIIEVRDRAGCGPTAVKMYKLTPERWKTAPYYVPVGLEDEAEEVQEEETAEEMPVAEPTAPPDAIVAPGKSSSPQPVLVNMAKGTPDVAICVVYRSVDLPFPVRFETNPGPKGRVHVTCRAVTPNSPLVPPQFFAVHSPNENTVSVESSEVNPYDKFLTPFILDNWGKSADKELIKSIICEAGDTPIAVFENIVRQKFPKGVGTHRTGLLISLAAEARRAYTAIKAKNASEESARPKPGPERALSAAETALLSWCVKCDDTRSDGTWNRGTFTPFKPARPCPVCQGKHKAAAK